MMCQGRAAFRKWLDIEPENPVALHMVAACGGAAPPQCASDGYLRREFDDFADTFDDVMVKLGYSDPDHLAAAVARHVQAPAKLDILVRRVRHGPLRRPAGDRAGHVTGVDLSPVMLIAPPQHLQ